MMHEESFDHIKLSLELREARQMCGEMAKRLVETLDAFLPESSDRAYLINQVYKLAWEVDVNITRQPPRDALKVGRES